MGVSTAIDKLSRSTTTLTAGTFDRKHFREIMAVVAVAVRVERQRGVTSPRWKLKSQHALVSALAKVALSLERVRRRGACAQARCARGAAGQGAEGVR
jgi:hypothetical protein